MTQRKQNKLLDEDQGQELKAARIFENEDIKPEVEVVKPAFIVGADYTVDFAGDMGSANRALKQSNTKPDKKPAKKWRWLIVIAVLIASMLELGLFVRILIEQWDWLAGIWLGVFLIMTTLLLKWLIVEYKGLKQLKRQSQMRQRSNEMVDTEIIGRAEQHCLQITKTLPENCQFWVSDWRNSVEEHHNDSEVLSLFEHKVIAKLDQLAIKQVSKNASAASVMIAVSPFALVDMLIVLWRNIHMMNQISQIYGLNLGYWARIKLIKNIFHTMLFAGAAEILSDAGNYALGTSITGKLSTRVAQGLGAGILTARIGLKAINESRPLPWLSVPKPGLSGISKQLLSDLQKHLK